MKKLLKGDRPSNIESLIILYHKINEIDDLTNPEEHGIIFLILVGMNEG